MYPKVKVRQEKKEEDGLEKKDKKLKALQKSHSLPVSPPSPLRSPNAVRSPRSPNAVRSPKGVSRPSSAVVPKCYVLQAPKPRVSVSEYLGACDLASDSSGHSGHEKDGNIDEDRVNNRACLVLPPRAVISSPYNDVLIGRRNGSKGREEPAGLKNYAVLQSRHAPNKVKSSSVTENSPSLRKPKEAASKSSNFTDSVQKTRRPSRLAPNQKTSQKGGEF